MNNEYPAIVVGAGISGMTAAVRLASQGISCCLITQMPLHRTSAVLDTQGINSVADFQDTPQDFFYDTVRSAHDLIHQKTLFQMCETAPAILALCQRLGVVFDRTAEGHVACVKNKGCSVPRTRNSSVSVGLQLTTVLCEQVARYRAQGLISLKERHDCLMPVVCEQQCVGVLCRDLTTGVFVAMGSPVVIFAAGKHSAVYGKHSINGSTQTGALLASAFKQGVALVNPEFAAFTPFAVCGLEKSYAVPEALLTSQNNVWYGDSVQGEALFEENGWQQNIPDVVLSQILYQKMTGQQALAETEAGLYLTCDADQQKQFNNFFRLIKMLPGVVSDKKMRIMPAMSEWLGGLWIDEQHMTNINGLFAAGSCAAQYKGAALLPGNSLLASLYGGFVAADNAQIYYQTHKTTTPVVSETFRASLLQAEEKKFWEYADYTGPENVFFLHQELADIMYAKAGPVRSHSGLKQGLEKIAELKQRLQHVSLTDHQKNMNAVLHFVRDFDHMLLLSRVMFETALARNESRGVHYRTDFPEPDNLRYLRFTKVVRDQERSKIYFEDVDQSVLKQSQRGQTRIRSIG